MPEGRLSTLESRKYVVHGENHQTLHSKRTEGLDNDLATNANISCLLRQFRLLNHEWFSESDISGCKWHSPTIRLLATRDLRGIKGKGKLGAYAMKRLAAGAHLPTPWHFEPAKRPDDRADYCLELGIKGTWRKHSFCLMTIGSADYLRTRATDRRR